MKNPIRTTVVALSLAAFALSVPPAAAADTFSLGTPTTNSGEILLLEGNQIVVAGIELKTDVEPVPYGTLPSEACSFLHGEILKLAETYGRLPAANVKTTDANLMPEAEKAPYDSDREADLLANEECREMRDEALTVAWDNAPAPVVPETCGTLRGIESCVAVHHWQCDIGFLTYYNLVSICVGGVFPDN